MSDRNQQSVCSGLTTREHHAWLDWMDYYKGIEIGRANDLTLMEPKDGDHYAMATQLPRRVAGMEIMISGNYLRRAKVQPE